MSFTFFFYIFLLLNVQTDSYKPNGNSFYSNAKIVFDDPVNYFSIVFVVTSASAVSFILERIYDQIFNIGLGLLKNSKFREGSFYLRNKNI